jgi:rubrerythrin
MNPPKERQAARYYQLVAGRSTLRPVRDLFYYLSGEEPEHVRWVGKLFRRFPIRQLYRLLRENNR